MFSSVTVRIGTKIGGDCGAFVGVGVKSSAVHSMWKKYEHNVNAKSMRREGKTGPGTGRKRKKKKQVSKRIPFTNTRKT